MVLADYTVMTNDAGEEYIAVSKKELEQIRKHYHEIGHKYRVNEGKTGDPRAMYYLGKRDVVIDILKLFEPLEP